MNDLISILIPVKNGSAFIEECITSILKQTIINWEIMIVNDHSTDNTLAILNQFEKSHSNIKVYNNIDSGIIGALRLAYAKSNGNYITRMDADDIMLSNKLEVLYRNLINNGKGYVATGLVKYFSQNTLGNGYVEYQNWLNKLTSTGSNYNEIYKECVIPSPSWMLHKEDLDLCDAFEPNIYPEDYDLCFRFYEHNLTVIPCGEIIHKWRDYPTRTSRTDNHYTNNTFIPLKCSYFIKLDYDNKLPLILWGAGKKGKAIANELIKYNIPFSWITNNQKKIGHNIYGHTIQNANLFNIQNQQQYIIAIANKEEQLTIKKLLNKQQKVYFFC